MGEQRRQSVLVFGLGGVAVLALAVTVWQRGRIGELEEQLVRALAGGGSEVVAVRVGSEVEAPGAGSGGEGIERAEAIEEAPLRGATLVEEGFHAAGRDLAAALAAVEGMEKGVGRREYLEGVFAWAAANRPPGEVLALAKQFGEDEEEMDVVLRSVVSTWTSGRSQEGDKERSLVERFGLETGLGMALINDEVFRPELGRAWMEAFADTAGSSVMFGAFASKTGEDDPVGAMALGDGFEGFERELFLRVVTDGWAKRDPAGAWEWVWGEVQAGGAGSEWLIPEVMPDLVKAGDGAADAALAKMTDTLHRELAVASIARATAHQKGTVAAVEWAEGLANDSERQRAYSVIAETAPQGIGAALSFNDGFTEVTKLVDGGSAKADGRIQPGDRIVAVDPGSGDFELIYGQPLKRALELITGDAGTAVRLRVVRDSGGGAWQEEMVELERGQLVLPPREQLGG